MHEFSIATEIVDSLLEFQLAHLGQTILKALVEVGELTCIDPRQLQFCYDSIIRHTSIAGSQLNVESVSARVNCPACGYTGTPRYWQEALADVPLPTLRCPVCGRTTEAIRGHECIIRSVHVFQPDPEPAISGAQDFS
jgi:hydrogenase nickel incorporation protein HypA/HybF